MNLFSQYELENIKLSNRMVMAPTTRCRTFSPGCPWLAYMLRTVEIKNEDEINSLVEGVCGQIMDYRTAIR